jgi:hypothetical protein
MTVSSSSSEQIFQTAREHLVLRASEALKPLVEFMELHECNDEEILEALFEAIAYEKDAEAELGVYAYDQQQDLSLFGGNFVADNFAELLYKFGVELFREIQSHHLYMRGFLPYQYMKRHGRDLVVSRLDIPSIQHRDETANPTVFNPVFGQMLWKPELRVVNSRTAGAPQPSTIIILPPSYVPPQSCESRHRSATPEETQAVLKQMAEHRRAREEAQRDTVEAFEAEVAKIFAGMNQRGDHTSPPGEGVHDDGQPMDLHEKLAKRDWSPVEHEDFRAIQDYYNRRPDMDQRSIVTQSELKDWLERMVKLKHRELAGGPAYQVGQRGIIDLVYKAQVLGFPEAIQELDEHIAKTVKVVPDDDAEAQ